MNTATRARIDVDAVKRDHPLAPVISAAGVRLRPAGPGRWTGCCPFHDDRTPSLLVDETDQHYHCFSCHAHGDVITFVMRLHGVDFCAAVERLAGTPPSPPFGLRPQRPDPPRRWDRRTLAEQTALNVAAALYHDRIWREPHALAYVRDRGIHEGVIHTCKLGYADGQSLRSWLRRNWSIDPAVAVGLLTGSGRERMAGRIVVPEYRGGHCVWMVGRTVGDGSWETGNGMGELRQHHRDRHSTLACTQPLHSPTSPSPTPASQLPPPKYLGLQGERPILGWERVVGQREVYLCEGVFDLLTAVGWGLAACSPCGTQASPDQLGFLARAAMVYGVFDDDAAGHAATARFGELLGDRWRPIRLPLGCDLNDLGSLPDGKEQLLRLVEESRKRPGKDVTG